MPFKRERGEVNGHTKVILKISIPDTFRVQLIQIAFVNVAWEEV